MTEIKTDTYAEKHDEKIIYPVPAGIHLLKLAKNQLDSEILNE